MEHRMVNLDAFDGVGIRTECPGRDISSIGPLWDRFFEEVAQVEGSQGVVGLSWGDGADGFSYLAGYKVPAGSGAALATNGLESYNVPGGRYVSVQWQGAAGSEMSQAFQEIFTRILPDNGQEMHPEGACIEDYPEHAYDPETNTLRAELLVRVKD
jgi:predicted transcriptional regulator YdeE